jgi:putative cell wall-binding protein
VILSVALVATIVLPPSVALAPPPPNPDTWYVDAVNGSDATGDGSAGNPFQTISEALSWADSVDEIMVAEGVYSPDMGESGEDFPLYVRDIDVIGTGDAALTVLDAEYESDIMRVSGTDVLIEGLTFRHGHASTGGAIHVQDEGTSEAIVHDCIFESNITEMFAFPGEGGAIAAYDAELLIEGCAFTGNGWPDDTWVPGEPVAEVLPGQLGEMPVFAGYGGAVYAQDSVLQVYDSEFHENAATFSGGAVFSAFSLLGMLDSLVSSNTVLMEPDVFTVQPTSADPDTGPGVVEEFYGMGGGVAAVGESESYFLDSTFTGNHAYMAAAVCIDTPGRYEMYGCTVTDNAATDKGGGVAELPWEDPGEFMGDRVAAAPEATFDAVEGFELAGVDEVPLDPDASIVEGTWFQGNEAAYCAALAAIADPFDEGVSAELGVWNSVFVGNDASPGKTPDSVLLALGTPALVDSSTFARNTGLVAVVRSVIGAEVDVTNTVFWDNELAVDLVLDQVEGLAAANGAPSADTENCAVSFSDTPNGDRYMAPGPGNVAADPLFVDADSGEFRLTADSPCVDTGTDGVAPPFDFDDFVRPVDGDLDGVDEYDMGAFEFDPARRLAGTDRYETAVAVSQEYFEEADTVVLATGRVFADGLAASGLAGAYGAPLLLTRSDMLPSVVADEIARLGAETVIICGQTQAVWKDVADALEGMGLEVRRIGGADRYETAALIAEEIQTVMGDEFAGVTFFARGDRFPDALAVSPTAYNLAAPILLVRPNELPASTVDVMSQNGLSTAIIAGGKAAVDAHVAKQIVVAATDTERVSGADRYETAAAVAEYVAAKGWSSWSLTGLATGLEFADALTGGAAIGSGGGVLLLTDPATLSSPAAGALADHRAEITSLRVLGGPSALSPAVMTEAQDILS